MDSLVGKGLPFECRITSNKLKEVIKDAELNSSHSLSLRGHGGAHVCMPCALHLHLLKFHPESAMMLLIKTQRWARL